MAELPTHDQWMKGTHSTVRPRSDLLKKLDDAVKTQNKDTVKTALDRWIFDQKSQAKDWRKSVRNEKGLVTQLYRAVGVDKRNLSQEELEALDFIARTQTLALAKQFMGKELKFKSNTAIGLANRAGTSWQQFKNGAGQVKSIYDTGHAVVGKSRDIVTGVATLQPSNSTAQTAAKVVARTAVTGVDAMLKAKVVDFCKLLCDNIDADTVFNSLDLGSVSDFASSLTPFLSVAKSGGEVLMKWGAVAKVAYKNYKVRGSRRAFAPGDPDAALKAVIKLLNRETASETAHATVATVAFTTQTVTAAFADGGAVSGPAIGLFKVLAEIFQTIVEFVIEYKECQAANELLRVGALNLDLFSASPILGCYFLVIQDHSTIINFAVGDYGTPNWMFDVEKLVRKVGLALESARGYINACRYEIPGMEGAKGVKTPNYEMASSFGKITGLKSHIEDQMMDQIDAWIVSPVKPPKVDQSRIVGYGPPLNKKKK